MPVTGVIIRLSLKVTRGTNHAHVTWHQGAALLVGGFLPPYSTGLSAPEGHASVVVFFLVTFAFGELQLT